MIALALISATVAIGGLVMLFTTPDAWPAGLMMLMGFGSTSVYAITMAIRHRGDGRR